MEEYALVGTFARQVKLESQQVADFRVPVLALFNEQANMETLATLLSA